jgi:lipopolysaccharide/colanic/teichoic acid biosynthesis glycosyltransferase
MRADAETRGLKVTAFGDPRVTPIGRVLRATKLDELPQLVNVLRGEMSLVGPRPEAPEYVDLYDERQREVLSVRPGITGPTQIRFRDEESLLQGPDVEAAYLALLPQKLEIDLDYVHNRSLVQDLTLLLATVSVVVRGGRLKQRTERE